MEKFNFDEIIDRHGTNSVKVDVIEKEWGGKDLLPLWVADMDFRTPQCVIKAISNRLENGIMGYTCMPESYRTTIVKWCQHRYNWSIAPEVIDYIPGIVPGMGMAIECFTKVGDKILIQPPVYHPFRLLTQHKQRTVVTNPLIYTDGHFEMDFEDLDRKLSGCRLMILCNPHNPGGKVWNRETLARVSELCARHHVLVFSDEIHADLTFAPLHHTPFASISEMSAQNSVTFMAPSKAFNMPGLVSSHTLIFNPTLRRQWEAYLEAGELNMGHVFSYLAVEAAYKEGEPWLTAVLDYIQGNIRYVDDFLKREIPAIHAILPEASYLIFLDCRDLKLSHEELEKFFIEKARLALNDGAMFGEEGTGFMRLNVASPRPVIEEAMRRLKAAYQTL